jgi:hypothetical protein
VLTADVTVVSCVYGPTFSRFAPRWSEYTTKMAPRPAAVVVASDRPHLVGGARVVVLDCPWKHPQAWYLNQAVAAAGTEWVWVVDIDDCVRPDGLAGIEDVKSDVWQTGYRTSDGVTYIPDVGAVEAEGNRLVGGSAVRVDAFRRVGGFRDVAYQDWDLWRRLRASGASFSFSGRVGFDYMRHPRARTATELAGRRDELIGEMLSAA